MAEVLVESGDQDESETVRSELSNLLVKVSKIVGMDTLRECLPMGLFAI